MKLELLPENDPQLHEVSEPWDFETDGDPAELVEALRDIMFSESAVGIAAPQCGVKKNIFLIYEPSLGKARIVINPKIVSLSTEKGHDIEGCLSFPDLFMRVTRSEQCIVEYQGINGDTIQEELVGYQARVFLHEFDHLIGVTFNERVGDLTYKMAKDKRKKLVQKAKRSLKTKVNASQE